MTNENIAAKKIRIAMILENIVTLTQLAELVECSAPNICNKFKRNNFSEKDLRTFADALGYDVEINLISRKTGNVSEKSTNKSRSLACFYLYRML